MKYFIAVWLILSLCACQNSSNTSGNEGPNGGDQVAQQAAGLVHDLVSIVEANSADFPEINLDDFRQAANRVRIIRKDRTWANGVETDATNNGFDLIELNGSRWAAIESDRRLALIFHELLGCIGLEKNTYYISSRLLNPENRFKIEQTLQCHSPSTANCSLNLRFDRSQKALVVTDLGCGNFAQKMNFFYKHDRRRFSLSKPCIDPDAPPPEEPYPCQTELVPEDQWASLAFLDGGRFFFTGHFRSFGTLQLICSNIKAP